METVIIIAAVATGLLLVELLLPTGGILAMIGAAGFITAGIVALGDDSNASDYVGPALITLGVLSIGTFLVITPKVWRAHKDDAVRTGWEELIGREVDVRETLDPVGQVWIEGALWKARLADGADPLPPGNRVVVEKVDGLTLQVRPAGQVNSEAKE
jgi:membrane-bound serine protease (ClpP class)